MKVEIQYIDKLGTHRKRWFRNAAEALQFAMNPPRGVAGIVKAPLELQPSLKLHLKASRRGRTEQTIAGLRHRSRGAISGPGESRPVIYSSSIQFSWARKTCRLSECFGSADEAATALVEWYVQGWAINTLAREFRLHRDTIRSLLVDNNVSIDRRRFRKLHEARAGWEEAFSKPTASALYWAGFLMADGSIGRRREQTSITCGLGPRDRDHVQALCDFVGRGKPRITKAKGQATQVNWRVCSQKMADDLARWGIVPNKGKIDDLSPKGEACMSVDFWRGMIDGDGSVGVSGKTPTVTLTGRRGISEAFVKFVAAKIPLKFVPRVGRAARRLRIYEYPQNGGATRVALSAKNAVSLCELLYWDVPDGLCLERKRKAAVKIVWQYRRTAAADKFL